MSDQSAKFAATTARVLAGSLTRLEVLALFPLLALSASWLGFDDLALVTAVVLSGLLAVVALLGSSAPPWAVMPDSGAFGCKGLIARLDQVASMPNQGTACFLLEVDDWADLQKRLGQAACDEISNRLKDRIDTALRGVDLVIRLGDSRYGVALGPVQTAQLGLRDSIASRMAETAAEPIQINGTTIRLSASVGHTALLRGGPDIGMRTFNAAEAALADATHNGPGAIRSYVPGMNHVQRAQSSLSGEVETALHSGAIAPWFQPQICAKTGALTGIEALARWQHPSQGLLSAKEFISAAEFSGHLPLLGQSMMHQALKSLAAWDKAQAYIPTLSLNLSATELRNPNLAEILAQEVDRYGIHPSRVVIEVTEETANRIDEDAAMATLAAMAEAGHQIDLDGFGLGQTSLPTLQRLHVQRLKIAPAFVVGLGSTPDGARAIAAIVALANTLGIATLAAGVETPKDAEVLANLGCDHLQGFGIARPMNAENVADWARARAASGKTINLDDRRA